MPNAKTSFLFVLRSSGSGSGGSGEEPKKPYQTPAKLTNLMGETKFKTFRKVMDDYLENGMNSTLAYQVCFTS